MLFPSTPLSTWCDPGINGTLNSNSLSLAHTHSVGGWRGWLGRSYKSQRDQRPCNDMISLEARGNRVSKRDTGERRYTHTRRAASPHKAHPSTAVQTGPCWKLGASGLISFNWSSNASSSPFPTAALELGGGGEAITGTADRYRSILTAFTAAVMDPPPPPPPPRPTLSWWEVVICPPNSECTQQNCDAHLKFYLPIPVAAE